MKALLSILDEFIFRFFMRYHSTLPLRWRKMLATAYPDARVRKAAWGTLGVHMGEGTFSNLGLLVTRDESGTTRIEIGDRVSIAPNVTIITESLPNNSEFLRSIPYVRERLIVVKSVTIEDDAWIGAGAILLPGVTIGRGAVVGAGAVVLKDVPPFSVVVGAPARIVRTLVQNPESQAPHSEPSQ